MTHRHTIELRHNRITLALHQLQEPTGTQRPLLLLHGLGERTPDAVPAWADSWTGPIYGLDFTGHGDSTVPHGGGYTAEILIGDVDTVIEHLTQPIAIAGRGLGAYVGLLAAGARRDRVDGVLLGDGPGLGGGLDEPSSSPIVAGVGRAQAPDPYALIELSHDLRPADYAVEFAQLIASNSARSEPMQVAARYRPPWLASVVRQPGVNTAADMTSGVAALAE